MTIGLRLRQSTRYLNLNAGRYGVTPSFVPPETKFTTQVTRGTALNKRGGNLVSKRPENREWKVALNVLADSHAEVDAAASDVQRWLNEAGDKVTPLFIEWRMDDSIPNPICGQFNAWRSYEIVQGGVTLVQSGEFNYTQMSGITLTLEIKPYAEGNTEQVGSAVGGISEDRAGVVDGRARGVQIPEATTNLYTNPVFGHSTYDNGWTTGANLVKAQVTDKSFCPFGFSAVRLSSASTTSNAFTQSLTLTVDNYNLNYYVYAPDRLALSAAQVQVIYDGAAQTTTFVALGNGLYAISANVLGSAAAHTCGIVVKQYATVILCGAQCENKTYRTPLAHGDLLGHAWTGTAHASSTTRTAARLRIPTSGLLGAAPFTVRVVWKTGAAIANGMTILDARDGSHLSALLIHIHSTSQFRATFGGASVAAGTIPVAHTTYVLHAVFNGQTIDLYVNGTALGAQTVSSLSEAGTYLYLGTDYSAANQCNGTLLGRAIFDAALTADQIAADCTAIATLTDDDKQVESVPWLWTKDGDNQVDNYYDTTHNMHSIVCGVPGTAPALTEMNLTTDENALGFDIYQALYATDEQIDASDFFGDQGGYADAAALGGEASQVTPGAFGVLTLTVTLAWKNFKGNEDVALLIRAKDAGSNLMLWASYLVGSTLQIDQTSTPSLVSTNYGIQLVKGTFVPALPETPGLTFSINAKRSTGSALYSLDYALVLPGKIMVLRSASNGYNTLEYRSDRRSIYLYNTGLVMEITNLSGYPIEIKPDKFNYLFSHVGDADTSTLARTVTYNWIKVTPRWELV